MTDEENPQPGVWHMALTLTLFAVVATLAIAVTHGVTAERIARNERQALLAQLSEVLPAPLHDNDLYESAFRLPPAPEIGQPEPFLGYLARRQGKATAVALPVVTEKGYGGTIRLLVGIRADGSVTGVRILSHKETPGLGDRVESDKSDWLQQFQGRSLQRPPPARWRLRRDGGVFDQISGASITPRAIVNAVESALVYFRTHRQRLLDPPADTFVRQ